VFLSNKIPIQEIAKRLAKHPATIYRELKRNQTNGFYFSDKAQQLSQIRRHESKPCPKSGSGTLMGEVIKKLKLRHSPEQIAGRLKLDYPGETSKHVSTETIYKHVYSLIENGEKELIQYLRRGKKKRHKHLTQNKKVSIIKDKIMIDQRPTEVESKNTCGHWEGDTIEGARKSGYIASFTERNTKLLLADSLPFKTAKNLNEAARIAFTRVPAWFKKTLTVDNGTEFAHHQALSKTIRMPIYFAHPYHSWERGLNEHTNGLLRQYYPKSKDLKFIDRRRLAKVVEEINNRPRKCLGYRTPLEAFSELKFALQT
jgi:IS30 family transposase